MMSVSINMVLNAEHRQDFGKIGDGLMKQILLIGFRGTLGSGQVEHQKMIKDVGSKFDDYSILPKIKQILLHWGMN